MKVFIQLFTLLVLTSQMLIAAPSEKGLASFYDNAFHGRKTASGVKYDKTKFTAAHKTLPFGTKVKITNPANGKTVIVEINDRGPYVKGRIIELSRKAAEKIGMLKKGVVPVVINVVGKNTAVSTSSPVATTTKPAKKDAATAIAAAKAKKDAAIKAKEKAAILATKTIKKETKPVATAPKKATTTTTAAAKSTAAKKAKMTKSSNRKTTTKAVNLVKAAQQMETGGLYKMQVIELPSKGFAVQVAAYSDYQSVVQQVAILQKKWFNNVTIFVDSRGDKPYYKVILEAKKTKEEAAVYNASIKKKYNIKDAFVVDLSKLATVVKAPKGKVVGMQVGKLYKTQVLKLKAKGFGVQVAGFSDYQAVIQQLTSLQKKWFKSAMVFVDSREGKPYYKVILGPMPTKEEASSYSASIKKNYAIKGAFVIDLSKLTK